MARSLRLKSVVDVLASFAMIAASLVVIWVALASRSTAPANASSALLPVEDVTARRLTISIKERPSLGAPTARLALIEFSDFECPFCRRYARETFASVKEQFIDTGVIAYAYFDLPLTNIHPHALAAAKAAKCAADMGRFWEMRAGLFEISSLRALTDEAITSTTAALGLERAGFDACLATAAQRVEDDVAEARRLDIRATPAFLLGPLSPDGTVAIRARINGAQPLEVFAGAIWQMAPRPSSSAH